MESVAELMAQRSIRTWFGATLPNTAVKSASMNPPPLCVVPGWQADGRVQIIQADGTVYQNAEGPLFVWDSCEACASNPIVDVSGV